MQEPTLVILAAGMGSRYGGMKQIDPMGRAGEIIMDYSIYDAVKAGFKKVVFLIRENMREDFEEVVGRRIAGKIEVKYAYQELSMHLPEGFVIPPERKKPWGTAHAILCCREVVDGPFVIINADDYYGPSAFRLIYDSLLHQDEKADPMDFSMVGYILGNTLTDKGKIARGVCETENGMLKSVIERTYVVKTPEGPAYSLDDGLTFTPLDAMSTVSMNFWGFTPNLFDELERRLPIWLREKLPLDPAKAEMYIPNVVGELLSEGRCTVRCLRSEDVWHGVTYKEDKADVAAAFDRLIDEGVYPEKLWD